MTINNLLEELSIEICDATKNFKLEREYHTVSGENFRPIKIFTQYIPTDLFEAEDYFPCVTVELIELRDILQGKSLATISISCGVFAKEFDAYRDAFTLLQIIRHRLLTKRTIAEKFRLTDEMVWQMPNQQPTPFFFVYGEAVYETFQPQEEFL